MSEKLESKNLDQLSCDFVGGTVGHRFRFGGGRGQDLARACGLKSGKNPFIVDATAGLGRDAFLLASLGAKVTLIERSAKMYELLLEGMAKARLADGDVAEVISRMDLRPGDAKTVLPQLNPQVVLVDPMHPPRNNSALVKKEMRLIRQIVGVDNDAIELMNVALATATDRVVLKWPRRGKPMDGLREPSHQISGKSTRYDVFMSATKI